MNVLPINTSNPNFDGKIIKKGHWTSDLNEVFDNHPELQKLKQSDKDIIAKMSTSWKMYPISVKHTSLGYKLEDVYKLTLTSMPKEPSLWDKVKLFLGFMPSASLTRHYHREFNTENLIRWNLNAKRFVKKLKLNG